MASQQQSHDHSLAHPADAAHHSGGCSHKQQMNRRRPALSISAADGVSRSGPLTPPLPMSAGVVTRRIHTEGRDGQFADAVKSLTAKGLTDPALGTGRTGGGSEGSSSRRTLSADSHQLHQCQLSISPNGEAAVAAGTNQAMPAADICCSSPQWQQQHQQHHQRHHEHASDTAQSEEETLAYAGQVEVVTAVWRAGLAGACTDHACVCFAIDHETGELQEGVTANHWYRVGFRGMGRVDTAAQERHTRHPDSRQQVTGGLDRLAESLTCQKLVICCPRPFGRHTIMQQRPAIGKTGCVPQKSHAWFVNE